MNSKVKVTFCFRLIRILCYKGIGPYPVVDSRLSFMTKSKIPVCKIIAGTKNEVRNEKKEF